MYSYGATHCLLLEVIGNFHLKTFGAPADTQKLSGGVPF